MRKYVVLMACIVGMNAAHALEITGAGSSAAAPLYTKWADAYANKANVKLAYQPIGSTAGIKKFLENATDFGATDVPMSTADLKKHNLLIFPTAISGVVPFVNLPGVKPGELRLNAELIVGIYSGNITKWNDAAIKKENPNLALPNQNIVPLARADGSGTTYTLTDYFSRVSAEWQQKLGAGFTVSWPSNVTTVKGTNDLVALLKKTPGAIGYAEYAYVIEQNLNYAQLKNRDGQYVQPNAFSFRTALSCSSWRKTGNFNEMLTDKPCRGSWPITGSTYVLLRKVATQPERTAAVIQFFTWAFMEGDEIANRLDYIRLPNEVQARVFSELSRVVDANGTTLPIPILLKK